MKNTKNAINQVESVSYLVKSTNFAPTISGKWSGNFSQKRSLHYTPWSTDAYSA
jgi:hypothetical protein